MVYPEEAVLLLEQGIRALVSLTERNPTSMGAFPAEIAHLHLPVPDMTAPTDEIIDRAMAFLDDHIAPGSAAAVHCGAGYGRTGAILACYLVHLGTDPEDAIQLVRARRPGSIETRAQEEAIRRYADRRASGGAGT